MNVSGNLSVVPFYGDTNVRTVLSTSLGTGLTWNSSTNRMNVVFPLAPLPYGDTEVRIVLATSAGTNMTWNTSTNQFDVSVSASYTDTNTRTVLSNSTGTNMTWNTSTNKFDVSVPASYTDTNTRTVLSNSADDAKAAAADAKQQQQRRPLTDSEMERYNLLKQVMHIRYLSSEETIEYEMLEARFFF